MSDTLSSASAAISRLQVFIARDASLERPLLPGEDLLGYFAQFELPPVVIAELARAVEVINTAVPTRVPGEAEAAVVVHHPNFSKSMPFNGFFSGIRKAIKSMSSKMSAGAKAAYAAVASTAAMSLVWTVWTWSDDIPEKIKEGVKNASEKTEEAEKQYKSVVDPSTGWCDENKDCGDKMKCEQTCLFEGLFQSPSLCHQGYGTLLSRCIAPNVPQGYAHCYKKYNPSKGKTQVATSSQCKAVKYPGGGGTSHFAVSNWSVKKGSEGGLTDADKKTLAKANGGS